MFRRDTFEEHSRFRFRDSFNPVPSYLSVGRGRWPGNPDPVPVPEPEPVSPRVSTYQAKVVPAKAAPTGEADDATLQD